MSSPERNRSRVGLSSTLIVTVGVCCLVSAIVNVMHVSTNQPSAAIHQTLQEFMNYTGQTAEQKKTDDEDKKNHKEATMEKRHTKLVDQKDRKGEEEEEEEVKDMHAMPHVAQAQMEKASQIAHLSCAADGGPEDEFAQEMVYWSDIPSDARYVSPFHARKGQNRRYLTFEPDGGKRFGFML